MFFIIFCILFLASIVYLLKAYVNSGNEIIEYISIIYIVGFICGFILHLAIGVYEHTEYNKNDLQIRYEQLEKNKDNPFLIEDIVEWNNNLIFNQKYQKDFWIGPYISNIYDDYKTIEIE